MANRIFESSVDTDTLNKQFHGFSQYAKRTSSPSNESSPERHDSGGSTSGESIEAGRRRTSPQAKEMFSPPNNNFSPIRTSTPSRVLATELEQDDTRHLLRRPTYGGRFRSPLAPSTRGNVPKSSVKAAEPVSTWTLPGIVEAGSDLSQEQKQKPADFHVPLRSVPNAQSSRQQLEAMDELRGRVAEVEAENRALQRRCSALQDKYDGERLRVTQLQERLAHSDVARKHPSVAETVSHMRLQADLARAQAHEHELEKEVAEFKREYEQVLHEREERQREVNRLRDEQKLHDDRKARRTRTDVKRSESEDDTSDSEASSGTSPQRYHRLKAEVDALKGEVRALKLKNRAYTAAFAAAEDTTKAPEKSRPQKAKIGGIFLPKTRERTKTNADTDDDSDSLDDHSMDDSILTHQQHRWTMPLKGDSEPVRADAARRRTQSEPDEEVAMGDIESLASFEPSIRPSESPSEAIGKLEDKARAQHEIFMGAFAQLRTLDPAFHKRQRAKLEAQAQSLLRKIADKSQEIYRLKDIQLAKSI